MASIYKRGKQFWVSYYVGNTQIKKTLKTTNERVARNKLKKIEYELALGELSIASKLPLPIILEAFCKELKATRTFKSYKNDFSRLRIFFGPICEALEVGVGGNAPKSGSRKKGSDKYFGKHVKAELLEDITPQLISRFISERKQQDNWSSKTINLLRQTLHKLFAFAIKHYNFTSRDKRYPNPAAQVAKEKEPAPCIRFLKQKDIVAQLEKLEDVPTIYAMVATYIYAGLRREEALWLTHEDVNLEKRIIRVQAKEIDGEKWQPKTKRNRIVPISNALYEILTSYIPPKCSIWYFPFNAMARWDPDNFSHELRKLNRNAGLPWSCLDFRHTFGSHLAQNGISLYKISTLMGNSPEICRRHYAALIPEEMAEIVEFEISNANSNEDLETKAMLKEILNELKGNDIQKPKIRLVK